MQQDMFVYSQSLFQNPIMAGRGAKVQGEFKLMPNAGYALAVVGGNDKGTILVLDHSGSMSGEGLANLIPAVESGIDLLEDGHTVGIIIFDDSFSWLVKPTELDSSTRRSIVSKVRNIGMGGMTRFTEPIRDGLNTLRQAIGEIKSFIVMTDGDSTVDPQRDNTNVEQMFLNDASGFAVELFGMGRDYNESVIAAWAKAARGNYYHITSNGGNMQQSMQTSFARAAHAVAGNVTVEFRTRPGVTIIELYRTVPQIVKVNPMNGATLAVDKIGTVNDMEGAPYQGSFAFTDAPPVGAAIAVSDVTVLYDLNGQQHEEHFTITVDTTDDRAQVQQDFSVAGTMQRTRIKSMADDAYQGMSVAQTMGDTAAMKNASRALTMAGTMATNAGDDDLADMIAGMGSDDPDQARANRTKLVSAGDLADLMKGMGDD